MSKGKNIVEGKKLKASIRGARGRKKFDNSHHYEILVSRLGSPASDGRVIGYSRKKDKLDGGDDLFYFEPTPHFSGIDFALGPFIRMKDLLTSVILHEDEILSLHSFR